GSFRFIGLPAPRAVLDDRRAARLRLVGRDGRDAHFVARRRHFRPLRTRTLNARTFVARLLLRFRLRLRRALLLRLLLLALRAAAQAAGGIEISRGGGSGTHGFFLFTWASKSIFFRAASSTRRRRDRCDRCAGGHATD